MSLEGLNHKFAIPEADRPVWESGTADLAGEEALDTGKLVLEVLGLLAESATGAVGASRFDSVPNAFGTRIDAVRDDRKVGRKQAVVVDKDDIRKALGHAGANKLGNQFAANGAPGVVHSVSGTNRFRIVERGGRVAIGENLQDESLASWMHVDA